MLGVRIALGLLATVSLTGTYTAIAELAKGERPFAAAIALALPWPLAVLGWVRIIARDRSTDARFVARVALAVGLAQIAVNVALDVWNPYENRYATPWWQVVALLPLIAAPRIAARASSWRATRWIDGATRVAAFATTLALAAQIASVSWVVASMGRDETRRADVAIVLGYGLDERLRARPPLVARTRHAVELYRRGIVPRLIVSGGGDPRMTEAHAMRLLAMRDGVPSDAIVLEPRAKSTVENLRFAKVLMGRHGMRSALVVSEPYHLPRAMLIAERERLDAHPSPSASGSPDARHLAHWVVREARLVLMLAIF